MNVARSVNTARLSAAALEKALAERLQELLGAAGISDWTVEADLFDRAFDLLATGKSAHGPTIELWVDCKTEARPSRFPYVNIEREFDQSSTRRVRAWVFAAPYISPRMAEVCESHGWSWFDLAGNCRIHVPTFLHIERRGMKPVHEAPRPTANLSTAEAGRVIRALLAPEKARVRWTQREMQRHCEPKVSIGLVNKMVRHLRDEAYIENIENGGFRLSDPLKLLFAWRDAYRFDRHDRRNYFTLLQGRRLREALAELNLSPSGHAAYAAFSAAELQAPHVRQPKTWLYLSVALELEFRKAGEAKPVDSGENLVVLFPEDKGVFYMRDDGHVGEPRLPCTNLVQTYVDLWHAGGRGQEAAEALLEQRLKPEWKSRNPNYGF